MSVNYIATDHLAVEEGGGVIYLEAMPHATLFQEVRCGRLTYLGGLRVYWPDELGEEPGWFSLEAELLERLWRTARSERIAEARAYYQQVCGIYDSTRGV